MFKEFRGETPQPPAKGGTERPDPKVYTTKFVASEIKARIADLEADKAALKAKLEARKAAIDAKLPDIKKNKK